MLARLLFLSLLAFLVAAALANPQPTPAPLPKPEVESKLSHEFVEHLGLLVMIVGGLLSDATSYGWFTSFLSRRLEHEH